MQTTLEHKLEVPIYSGERKKIHYLGNDGYLHTLITPIHVNLEETTEAEMIYIKISADQTNYFEVEKVFPRKNKEKYLIIDGDKFGIVPFFTAHEFPSKIITPNQIEIIITSEGEERIEIYKNLIKTKIYSSPLIRKKLLKKDIRKPILFSDPISNFFATEYMTKQEFKDSIGIAERPYFGQIANMVTFCTGGAKVSGNYLASELIGALTDMSNTSFAIFAIDTLFTFYNMYKNHKMEKVSYPVGLIGTIREYLTRQKK